MSDDITALQNKGFGSHGGKQYIVNHDITPLKKRVLVSHMHFGETYLDISGGFSMAMLLLSHPFLEHLTTSVPSDGKTDFWLLF